MDCTAAHSRPASQNGDYAAMLQAYRDAGLQIVPIRTDGTKAPAIPEWKPLQDPANRVELHRFAGRGVAIIYGQASDNAELLDFDKAALFSPWCELVEELCPGLVQRLVVVTTPRRDENGEPGRHVVYRCDQVAGNTDLAFYFDSQAGKKKASIQTRGEGGYALAPGCPPKCHPTGRCYELQAGDLCDLPHVTMAERDVLFTAARALSEYDDNEDQNPAPAQQDNHHATPIGDTAGDDFAAKTSWDEILTPHGWTRAGNDLWRRPGKEGRGWSASTRCQSKRGRPLLKVFSSNAEPFVADGTYNKFSAYATLNHSGDYTAAARALWQAGYGKQDDGGVDLSGFLDENKQDSGTAPPERTRIKPDFGRLTTDELLNQDFRVEYLIDGVLADQQYGAISGRFKAQKTHFTVAAAISIASGAKFLNHFEVARTRRVGMFCGEGGPAPLQRLARAICEFQDVQQSRLSGLFWYTRVPRLGDAAHRLALLDAIAADKLNVIFLDPTYLLLSDVSEKASNFLVMANALSLLTDIGQQTGIAANVVHHNKKSSELTVPELSDLAFSGICEWAGQWILLGHRAPFDPDTKQSKLWMNIGGRLGHGGLYGVDVDEQENRWTATVASAKDARQDAVDVKAADKRLKQDAELEDMREKIRMAFRSTPDTKLSKRRLAERVGSDYRGKTFMAAIAVMIRSKELEPADVETANHRTTDGYQRLFPADE